jgi:hypothetical protein
MPAMETTPLERTKLNQPKSSKSGAPFNAKDLLAQIRYDKPLRYAS